MSRGPVARKKRRGPRALTWYSPHEQLLAEPLRPRREPLDEAVERVAAELQDLQLVIAAGVARLLDQQDRLLLLDAAVLAVAREHQPDLHVQPVDRVDGLAEVVERVVRPDEQLLRLAPTPGDPVVASHVGHRDDVLLGVVERLESLGAQLGELVVAPEEEPLAEGRAHVRLDDGTDGVALDAVAQGLVLRLEGEVLGLLELVERVPEVASGPVVDAGADERLHEAGLAALLGVAAVVVGGLEGRERRGQVAGAEEEVSLRHTGSELLVVGSEHMLNFRSHVRWMGDVKVLIYYSI